MRRREPFTIPDFRDSFGGNPARQPMPRPAKDRTMPNPLYDRLFGVHAGKDTPFLHLPDGEVITHAGFLDTAARIANALTGLGLEPGNRVAVQVQKSPEAPGVLSAEVLVDVHRDHDHLIRMPRAEFLQVLELRSARRTPGGEEGDDRDLPRKGLGR